MWSQARIDAHRKEAADLNSAVITVAREYIEIITGPKGRDERGRLYWDRIPHSKSYVTYNAEKMAFTVTWGTYDDDHRDVSIPAYLLWEAGWQDRVKAEIEAQAKAVEEAKLKAELERTELQEKRDKENYERLQAKYEGQRKAPKSSGKNLRPLNEVGEEFGKAYIPPEFYCGLGE